MAAATSAADFWQAFYLIEMTPIMPIRRFACLHKIRLLISLLICLAFGPISGSGAEAQDASLPQGANLVSVPVTGPGVQREGPHVFVSEQGYAVVRIVPTAQGFARVTETLPAQPLPVIAVQVDNPAQTVFNVSLRPTPTAVSADIASKPTRLLMLSDFEGEFDKFVALLTAQHVIDAEMHWRYGAGHLVLVGDFVDRGEWTTPLLWLIYRLEAEAEAAGGQLHYLLGNHEQMMMSGRTKYWSARQVAFAAGLGEQGHRRLYGPQSVLGAWLARKPVIARVGDHLFVHGGISERFLSAGLSVDAANARARSSLFIDLALMPEAEALVLGEHGVTWYRGMALRDDPMYVLEADPKAHLQAVLKHYGAKRLAIGHSIVPNIILEQDGLLLRLDVHHATQVPEAALLKDGILWRVDAEGRRERLDDQPTTAH